MVETETRKPRGNEATNAGKSQNDRERQETKTIGWKCEPTRDGEHHRPSEGREPGPIRHSAFATPRKEIGTAT